METWCVNLCDETLDFHLTRKPNGVEHYDATIGDGRLLIETRPFRTGTFHSIKATVSRKTLINIYSEKALADPMMIVSISNGFNYSQCPLPQGWFDVHHFQLGYLPSLNARVELQPGPTELCVLIFKSDFLRTLSDDHELIREILEAEYKKLPLVVDVSPLAVSRGMLRAYLEITENLESPLLDWLLHSRALDLLRLGLSRVTPETLHYPQNLNESDARLVSEVYANVLQKLDEPFDLERLAQMSGMSISKLERCFYGLYHDTIIGCIRREKLTRAYRELENTERTMKSIAGRAGYKRLSSFSVAFKKEFKMTPAEVRRPKV